MSRYDLMVRNGILVTPTEIYQADVGVAEEQIVAIAPDLSGTSKEEIDARGLHLFPGLIDAHVHLNEPGRAHWEGFMTGTSALAAGGITTYFDMPLNASPPTLDAPSFDAKYSAAAARSQVDFALWGGLVPGKLDCLPELAERGVIGFKAFMSRSGTSDFQAADDLTLYEGMALAARLGCLVAVHAESDVLTNALMRRALEQGQITWRDYVNSRPVVAELEAIERAITFASETGCALHIVHVSTGRGVALVTRARRSGIDVSCETCPHYLVLHEEDLEALGSVAKCAPPLRSRAEQEALWQHIFAGNLPMIASDHSPAPWDLKTDANFFKVWGGISGCQSTLPLLLTEGYERRQLPLTTIPTITAEYIARRFGLWPHKGHLGIGADADMVLVDIQHQAPLQATDLFYRHKQSPYVGKRLRGRIVYTLLRGKTVFHAGKMTASQPGRFLRPGKKPPGSLRKGEIDVVPGGCF